MKIQRKSTKSTFANLYGIVWDMIEGKCPPQAMLETIASVVRMSITYARGLVKIRLKTWQHRFEAIWGGEGTLDDKVICAEFSLFGVLFAHDFLAPHKRPHHWTDKQLLADRNLGLAMNKVIA